MVGHHLRLGIKGLFLAGTNGEGPWLPEREKRRLVAGVANHAGGKMVVAVQVTDNSPARVIDNMRAAKEDGADIAVIAPPYVFFNATIATLFEYYHEAIEQCPLPVGIYDKGKFASTAIPNEVLKDVYDEGKVVLIKDSSLDPGHAAIALAARKKRPELLLNGSEFDCAEYVEKGYDGLLLGGGVFNGFLAGRIIDAVKQGNIREASRLQKRMNRIMYDVYGGKKIGCWLSGEKMLLMKMGILSTWRNFPKSPLTKNCIRAIERVLANDKDILFP